MLLQETPHGFVGADHERPFAVANNFNFITHRETSLLNVRALCSMLRE
jgi:hypothetical protein